MARMRALAFLNVKEPVGCAVHAGLPSPTAVAITRAEPVCHAGIIGPTTGRIRREFETMANTREPILHPIPILSLRPTQMTVGMREVKEKRKRWREHKPRRSGPSCSASI